MEPSSKPQNSDPKSSLFKSPNQHIMGKAVSDLGTQEELKISFIRNRTECGEFKKKKKKTPQKHKIKIHWRETDNTVKQASILFVERLNG